LRAGERATADIRCPARKRIMELLKAFRIGGNEFGAMTFGLAQHVMKQSTCSEQSGPEPIPIVGIVKESLTRAVSSAGVPSNTKAKQLASCRR
jgi:hypothetical protein